MPANAVPLKYSAMLPLLLFAFCAIASDPNPPDIHSSSGAWPIRRQWTPAETHHYAKWVENIYRLKTTGDVEQRTAKLERILTDSEMNLLENPAFLGEGGNKQLSRSLIREMHSLMDCGKFTAFMPAYYAYRRALPWMTTVVTAGEGDIRTSPYNIPVGNSNSFTSSSVTAFFRNAVGSFISGNYRVNLEGKNAHLSDTVPVAINRQFLLPGCINYLDGHCLLLAYVSEYGELHFLNCSTAHTRDVFSYNGMNTVSGITPTGNDPTDAYKGCFQGLRVLRYPIAITDKNGRVKQVRRRTNEEMQEFGFSTEQYDIVREISRKQFIDMGKFRVESFHDFIRMRMKTVDSVAPLAFMEQYANELLEAYVMREQFVQEAWKDVRAHGPIVYPEERRNENIFEALGRWETWSSPSSDVDRRNKYFYLADWLEYVIRLYGIVPEFVDLTGLEQYNIHTQENLAQALIAEKKRIFAAHTMTYTNSKGKQIPLTLLDIEKRLYDLSFDPNHPPELRWGAPENSEERASAPKTVTPVPNGEKIPMDDAYRWQYYYRCLGARETDVSCLRGMFTTGFPIRDKLDAQLAKWIDSPNAAAAQTASQPPEPSPAPAVVSTPPPPVSIPASSIRTRVVETIDLETRDMQPIPEKPKPAVKTPQPAQPGISKKPLPPKKPLPTRKPVQPVRTYRRNF